MLIIKKNNFSYLNRLRKYARKKNKQGFNDYYAMLYWRYHKKVFGEHKLLYSPSLMQWRLYE